MADIKLPGYAPATAPALFDSVVNGLKAVETLHGISTAGHQAAIAGLKQKLMENMNDPNSSQSQAARQEAEAGLDLLSKKGSLSNDKKSALQNIIEGNTDTEGAVPLSAAELAANKEASPLYDLTKAEIGAQGMQNKFGALISGKKEMQQNAIHEKVLNSLTNDPVVKQRLTQYQNLNNSLSLLTNADNLTPQQFDEAQQSLRSNLGIKGTSGVDERGHTYLNSLGLNADRFQQMLSGKPASMDPNDPFIKHVKNLANLEQQNIRQQATDRLSTLAGGNSWLYNDRPELKTDLDNRVQGMLSQFNPTGPISSQSMTMPKGVDPNDWARLSPAGQQKLMSHLNGQ